MRVLGVDANSSKVAWAIVNDGELESYGEIFFREASFNGKLYAARRQLEDIVPLFGEIDYIGFEQAVRVNSVATMIMLAEMFGVIKSCLLSLKATLVEISAPSWGAAIGNPSISGIKRRELLALHPELKTKSQQSNFIRKYRKQLTLDYVERRTGVVMPNDDLGDATAIAYVIYDKTEELNEKAKAI